MEQTRIPDIYIEQYLLDELPEAKRREVEDSPGFQERLAVLKRSNQEILAEYPPAQMAIRIRNQHNARIEAQESASARESKERRRFSPVRWIAVAVPGAAAVLTAVILSIQALSGGTMLASDDPNEIVRLKGTESKLMIYRSVDATDGGNTEAERLEDGGRATQGDRLQIAYQSAERQFGVIVSVDGRGTVTLHFPLSPSAEPRLVMGREHKLAFAYRLDDAPAFETFYFITSATFFAVPSLVQRVRDQAAGIAANPDMALSLTDEFDVQSFTVRKGD
ncbi:MAG: hypothetical protein E4H09_00975 [Spirochaetales bacterium]|nr:MAG: hypothetical protein E4H09_00975 [Spirochaetales bacterium]